MNKEQFDEAYKLHYPVRINELCNNIYDIRGKSEFIHTDGTLVISAILADRIRKNIVHVRISDISVHDCFDDFLKQKERGVDFE